MKCGLWSEIECKNIVSNFKTCKQFHIFTQIKDKVFLPNQHEEKSPLP